MQQLPIVSSHVHLNDIDQARAYLQAAGFGQHDRIQLGKGSLGLELLSVATPSATVGWASTQVASVVRAAVQTATVHLPQTGSLQYRIGRRALSATSASAAILAPGHEYTLHNPGSLSFGLRVGTPLLQEELESRRRPKSKALALRCIEAPISAGSAREFHLIQRQFANIARSPRDPASDSAIAMLERSAAGWMAQRILENEGCLAATPASLQLAEDIDRWIRCHLTEAITLDRLATAFGVSIRTLQLAVLARWGRSPMELLAHRRLAHARTLLESSRIGMRVTHAALRSGFAHLGRFAVQYKQTFGESPSDTLERSAGGTHDGFPRAHAGTAGHAQ